MPPVENTALGDLADRYGPVSGDPDAFRRSLDRPLERFIWANTLRVEPERLRSALARDGFGPEPLPWHPAAFRVVGNPEGLGNHWTYLAGLFHIQEASSMVPPLLLDLRPGHRVLDLCAAPGGKAALAAVALENRGTVVANDLVGARLRPLRMTMDRLGLTNVTVSCHDGVNFPKSAGSFDFVLADVPCSCEGTSRKNPGVLDRPGSETIRPFRKQELLLRQAVRRCRPGGRIVYSTCTDAPEENEGVVAAVLADWPDRVRLVPATLPGFQTAPGLTAWGDRVFPDAMRHCLRIWPHLNDTGGFFAAVLEKLGPETPEGNDGRGEPPTVAEPGFPGTAASGQCRAADDAGLRKFLTERFGLPDAALAEAVLLEKPEKQLFLAAKDHRPPILPDRTVGLPILHLKGRLPKLTTAGAVALAPTATRNAVDATADQRNAYAARRPFEPTEDQRVNLDGGWAIVRYEGFGLGLGLFRKETGIVESFFPKHLAVG